MIRQPTDNIECSAITGLVTVLDRVEDRQYAGSTVMDWYIGDQPAQCHAIQKALDFTDLYRAADDGEIEQTYNLSDILIDPPLSRNEAVMVENTSNITVNII